MSSSQETMSIPAARNTSGAKGWRFWIILIALNLSLFLPTFDLASLSTALPTIIHDLHGTQSYAWITVASTLASTALIPLSDHLGEILGRRPILVASLMLYTTGSAISASAHSMNVLIAGRAVQGAGSGGIQALVTLILGELIDVRERGYYSNIVAGMNVFASAAGPIIAGVITTKTTWRWLFYVATSVSGTALILTLLFLRPGTSHNIGQQKSLLSVDWVGIVLTVGSATSFVLAITWAGGKYPWASIHVFVPIIIGGLGLICALLYEIFVPGHPATPIKIISNITSLSGCLGTFISGFVTTSIAFYLPLFFQAVKGTTPLISGLYLLPFVVLTWPAKVVQERIIANTELYPNLNYIGWGVALIGVGSLCSLSTSTAAAVSIPIQIVAAVGLGGLYVSTYSAIAPLERSATPRAFAFLLFLRSFAQTWAVTLGTLILQNELRNHLPSTFLSAIPTGQDIIYTSIPQIAILAEPLRSQVRAAFAKGLNALWKALLGLSALGLLSVSVQKQFRLPIKVVEEWGLEGVEKEREPDIESGDSSLRGKERSA